VDTNLDLSNDIIYIYIYLQVTVRSIESMYVPLKEVRAGQTTALAVRSLNKKQSVALNRANFRKGMVLISSHVDVTPFVSRRYYRYIYIYIHIDIDMY
jgi:hypothetical protein